VERVEAPVLPPEAPPAPETPRSPRRWMALVAGAVLVVALAAGAGVVFRESEVGQELLGADIPSPSSSSAQPTVRTVAFLAPDRRFQLHHPSDWTSDCVRRPSKELGCTFAPAEGKVATVQVTVAPTKGESPAQLVAKDEDEASELPGYRRGQWGPTTLGSLKGVLLDYVFRADGQQRRVRIFRFAAEAESYTVALRAPALASSRPTEVFGEVVTSLRPLS
jgi:hypothetical protein